jgi:ABC-type transport system involved in multi-copper enzyme maturation permease subunit
MAGPWVTKREVLLRIVVHSKTPLPRWLRIFERAAVIFMYAAVAVSIFLGTWTLWWKGPVRDPDLVFAPAILGFLVLLAVGFVAGGYEISMYARRWLHRTW